MTQPREVTAKIVFYGPGMSGKTTNLKKVYAMLKAEARGKLMALSTQSDRTIFFDYLPINLGKVRGMQLKIQLYTVPGQVFYNSTRRLVLKNVDGVVFVADSGRRALPDNLESLSNLQENLKLYGKSLHEIPWVIQYNKRDLEDAVPVETLREKLNRWNVPEFEACAARGTGVMETLSGITKLVVKRLSKQPIDERPTLEDPVSPPVDVESPKLAVPEEEYRKPRVPGALTDDEIDAIEVEPEEPQTEETPFRERPMLTSPETVPAIAEPRIVEPSPGPAQPEPADDGPVEEAVTVEDEELEEIEIEDDFSEEVEPAEIEPMEEIRVTPGATPRWRDGTLIVPLEIRVGDSEFVHEIEIHLNPTIRSAEEE